jgi:hypothetical protein
VFDEAVFPFKTLHPNARALLRKEILSIDPSLHSFVTEDEHIDDTHDDYMHTTNPVPSAPFVVPQGPAVQIKNTAQNFAENDTQNNSNASHEISEEEASAVDTRPIPYQDPPRDR